METLRSVFGLFRRSKSKSEQKTTSKCDEKKLDKTKKDRSSNPDGKYSIFSCEDTMIELLKHMNIKDQLSAAQGNKHIRSYLYSKRSLTFGIRILSDIFEDIPLEQFGKQCNTAAHLYTYVLRRI